MNSLTAAEISQKYSLTCLGLASRVSCDGQSVDSAQPGMLCFSTQKSPWASLSNLSSVTVLLESRLQETPEAQQWVNDHDQTLLFSDDPLGDFLTITAFLRGLAAQAATASSVISGLGKEVHFAASAQISRQATIGDRVTIGERSRIHPGVVISEDCVIGDDVVIYPNTVLYPRCKIGSRVLIHANAVLGADGFGFRFQQGKFAKNEHLGHLEIGDDVEIGAGTTIDRGMIGPTVIGNGTKIDDQVMIGHNCRIGSHNVIASQVGFAGSTTTGDYCQFGGQAGIADHLKIGNGCRIGAKAGIHCNIPDGQTYVGAPAGPESEQRRIVMSMPKLPEMRQRMRQMEKELQKMKEMIEQNFNESTSKAA